MSYLQSWLALVAARASRCGHRRTRRPPLPLSATLLLACALLQVGGSAQADAEHCLEAHEKAQVQRLESHYVEARELLLTCAQRDCPRLVNSDCSSWLAELDASMPTVVFAVSDDAGRDLLDARVLVNGRLLAHHIDGRALALNPGVYTVRFEADGYAPDELSLSVRDGEKSRLVRGTLRSLASVASVATPSPDGEGAPAVKSSSPPQDDSRARRLRIAGYTLAGASVASFTLTLGAGLRGHAMLAQCEQDGCSQSHADRGEALYRTVNVSAIVGGVLLVVGGASWVAAHLRARADHRAQLAFAPAADLRAIGVQAWGRW